MPDERCIELKALKYYLIGFRNPGIFYEAVTNQILDDLVAVCQPRRMTVVGDFTPRGGIKTVVTVQYTKVGSRQVGSRQWTTQCSGSAALLAYCLLPTAYCLLTWIPTPCASPSTAPSTSTRSRPPT